MMNRLPIILLFSIILGTLTASAQQRESVTQVVTFGVKWTNASQRAGQIGIAGGEQTQRDLYNGSMVTSTNQQAVHSRAASLTSFQEKAAQRRQSTLQQSSPAVRVVTITD